MFSQKQINHKILHTPIPYLVNEAENTFSWKFEFCISTPPMKNRSSGIACFKNQLSHWVRFEKRPTAILVYCSWLLFNNRFHLIDFWNTHCTWLIFHWRDRFEICQIIQLNEQYEVHVQSMFRLSWRRERKQWPISWRASTCALLDQNALYSRSFQYYNLHKNRCFM